MRASGRLLTFAEAIREGLETALESMPEVFLMGEGVNDPKGIFGTTSGLAERFGKDRVIETPISENGFTGIAIGAALLGQRPIVVHQRVEFVLLALEQLINNAAKLRYLSQGVYGIPMVIRLIIGRGWGQGPQHSQALESLFAAIPGLKVAMPSDASDARDLLLAGVTGGDPLIVLEHRWLHGVRGWVGDKVDPTVLEGPTTRRTGSHVTVVATSYMVLEALLAAEVLADVGVEVEVVDLRVLRPLNLQAIRESVRKTGRLLVVDTGHRTLGPGAEIVATLVEQEFEQFTAPPRRLGLPDRPNASSKSLAGVTYPRAEDVVTEIAAMLPVTDDQQGQVAEALASRRGDLPLDVPDPAFVGPF